MTKSAHESLVGYVRASTADQSIDVQTDALHESGCTRIFTDIASGALTKRPQLTAALDYLREGDVLVVWKLDRLGRSLRHLVTTVDTLRSRGIGFRSIQEHIDTTTSEGQVVFQVFCALAEFKRDLIHERTQAGLAAARARGRTGGRKPALTQDMVAMARDLFESGEHTVAEIAEMLGTSRATIYRTLKSSLVHDSGVSRTSGTHVVPDFFETPRAEALREDARIVGPRPSQ